MSPIQLFPPPAGASRLIRLAVVLVSTTALLSTIALMVPAEASAADRSVSVSPGRTATTASTASVTEGTARGDFVVPALTRGTVTFAMNLRRQTSATKYAARVAVSGKGTMHVDLVRVAGGRITVLSTQKITSRVRASQTVRLEGSISGSHVVVLKVRAYKYGTPRPSWQTSTQDSSTKRISKAGKVLATISLSRSASRSVKVTYRNLQGVENAAPTRKPSASTTGVPADTKLKVHHGSITVTKDGTRLDKMDIRGFVVVKAADVRITRSIVRGGVAKNNQGLITNYGSPNLVIEDTDLVAAHPSVWLDGIKGWNFTARRVHVVGNVDSIKIHGDNVRIENSLLEQTVYYAHDPNQRGGPTHNDNIQILNGRNIAITGNDIRGSQNFAILAAANLGHTTNLKIEGNWLDGGHCTVKLQSMKRWKLEATVTGNTFGPHRAVSYCAFQAEPQVTVSAGQNRMESDGQAVTMLRVR